VKLEFEIDGPGPLGGPAVAPFIVCATCGTRITNGQANALFEPDGAGGRTGSVAVVHRGECDPKTWEWQRLPSLMIQLLHNSGYDLDEVWREVQRMRERERQWTEAGER
jgi:hypothetical protein